MYIDLFQIRIAPNYFSPVNIQNRTETLYLRSITPFSFFAPVLDHLFSPTQLSLHKYVKFFKRSTVNSVDNSLSIISVSIPYLSLNFSVFAPPGGRSNNIFGVPEPEAPVTTKKNHMESDIFGCKKDNTDSTPVKYVEIFSEIFSFLFLLILIDKHHAL